MVAAARAALGLHAGVQPGRQIPGVPVRGRHGQNIWGGEVKPKDAPKKVRLRAPRVGLEPTT